MNSNTNQMHANVLAPSMVMAHDPQIPSRQDRRNVSVGSISFLILMRASRTIGPQSLRSTSYDCMCGLSPGLSGFCQRHNQRNSMYLCVTIAPCNSRMKSLNLVDRLSIATVTHYTILRSKRRSQEVNDVDKSE